MRGWAVAISVVLSACNGDCPEGPFSTTQSDFPGIEGAIYWQDLSCGAHECPSPFSDGLIRVLQDGVLVTETSTDTQGEFSLLLAPGSYAIEIAIPIFPVDRRLTSTEISEMVGLQIERTYDRAIKPDRLTLGFYESVPSERMLEILHDQDLSWDFAGPPVFGLNVPPNTHPQLLGEYLVTQYPGEVEWFELDPWTLCGG